MQRNQFTNLLLTNDFIDLYVIRRSILNFINKNGQQLYGTLLDIGCGEMPYKDTILSFGKVTRYIGLDVKNSKHYDTSIADINWEGESIPLDDSSVDSILSTEFLEHYPDTQKVINEMYRVLRPGGKVIISVPFIWTLHLTPNDEYRFTPFSLERFFNKSGFKQTKFVATGGLSASLALMIGLWTKHIPMRSWKRKVLYPISKFIMNYLVKKDTLPLTFKDNSMIVGIGGIITK